MTEPKSPKWWETANSDELEMTLGWRVTRVHHFDGQHLRHGYWRAVADYYDAVTDFAPDDPRPDYFRYADGWSEAEARAKVLALCRADDEWPLMLHDCVGGRVTGP